jgi:hypothetical protein
MTGEIEGLREEVSMQGRGKWIQPQAGPPYGAIPCVEPQEWSEEVTGEKWERKGSVVAAVCE